MKSTEISVNIKNKNKYVLKFYLTLSFAKGTSIRNVLKTVALKCHFPLENESERLKNK